jgi:hypothetical protein
MSHAATWAFSKSHSTIDSRNGCLTAGLVDGASPAGLTDRLPLNDPGGAGRRSVSTWRISSLYLAGARLGPQVVDVGEMGISIQHGEAPRAPPKRSWARPK